MGVSFDVVGLFGDNVVVDDTCQFDAVVAAVICWPITPVNSVLLVVELGSAVDVLLVVVAGCAVVDLVVDLVVVGLVDGAVVIVVVVGAVDGAVDVVVDALSVVVGFIVAANK